MIPHVEQDAQIQQPNKGGWIGAIFGGLVVLIVATATNDINNDDLTPLFSFLVISMLLGGMSGACAQQVWSNKLTQAANNDQEVNAHQIVNNQEINVQEINNQEINVQGINNQAVNYFERRLTPSPKIRCI